MKDAIRHLDKRFATLRPLTKSPRPPKGWLRAVRDALGMTTSQFARRLKVSQPRIVELEQSEVSGSVTLNTLQRAAEALGCRLVYVLVPERPLAETVRERAVLIASRQMGAVTQTMRLEDQEVRSKDVAKDLHRQEVERLLRRPARLWDENDGSFDADDAATPLTPAERAELIPTHVTLRGELNELEQQNIAEAYGWAFERKRNVLDEAFLRGLHRRMFNQVWRWAGDYRKTERNIGVKPYLIQPGLVQAIDDARHWVELESYEPDELAVRFHHKIVQVHPFSNGNGRWSRLAPDLLVTAQGGTRFSWGGADLQSSGDARKRYIDALHAADNHDFGPLIAFARS